MRFTQVPTQTMQDLVLVTAKKLLLPQNRTTTLEVKKQLILDYPAIEWKQAFVHDAMDLFYQENLFIIVDDNGIYRTYADPNYNPMVVNAHSIIIDPISLSDDSYTKTISLDSSDATIDLKNTNPNIDLDRFQSINTSTKNVIDKNKAKDLMKNNKGHYFTAFVKENGDKVVLNCQYIKSLQHPNVVDAVFVKLRKNTIETIKRIDLNSLIELSINKQNFEIINQ